MKFYWLLPSLVSVLMFASAAEAARLQSWRFDANRNRLHFTTEGGVQPQAQLVFNPTRLVIDLPGVVMNSPTVNQQASGALQAIRVGQFNSQTTRIVVELKPGYTLDPEQVQFRGISPSQWTVDIPTPVPVTAANPRDRRPRANPAPQPIPRIDQGTSRPTPQPPAPTNPRNLPAPPAPIASGRLTTIQSIDLALGGSQLLIGSDQGFTYSAQWDSATSTYEIKIPSAQLSARIAPPRLDLGGPLAWVRLRQEEPDTVVIVMRPAAGVRIGQVNQPSPTALSLELEGGSRAIAPRPLPPRPISAPQPPTNYPAPAPPPLPSGRLVVVLDPGHGGRDPGAVGIGGLREKDVVLPITQEVARILEQRGIQTILTRASDLEVDLQPRVDVAERVRATVFVSIHANAISMSRPDVNGLETYYYDSGLALARTIHQNLLRVPGVRDRGVRQARFYVLRRTSMPAVLVEVGFVTGNEDATRLANPNYRSQVANGIANGILQYLGR